jgi:type III restriction enzyme
VGESYIESDTALVARVLGKEIGGKQNILVLNDEAHHAYRILQEHPDDWEQMDEDDREGWLADRDEATVWIDGLDRVQKLRGINFCVDLSATPYFLGRVGQEANKPFPWVVSDFGLIDAIEAGLVRRETPRQSRGVSRRTRICCSISLQRADARLQMVSRG